MKFVVGFLLLWLIFGVLEWRFPLNTKQKHFRNGWLTDVVHFFSNHILINAGTYLFFWFLYVVFHGFISRSLQLAVRSQPAFLQFSEAFLIAQLVFYFFHRLAHHLPFLWRFHAIHHSSAELDWLASARVHPMEMIIVNLAIALPLFWLGFTRETFGAYLLFGAILPIFNHSNVRFRFPVLNKIISTPEFHHWHHSIDLLFGTYYVPDHEMPKIYGIDEYIPNSYWQQMLYPFRRS